MGISVELDMLDLDTTECREGTAEMVLKSRPAYICPDCWECAEANGITEDEILVEYVEQLRDFCIDEAAFVAAGIRWP